MDGKGSTEIFSERNISGICVVLSKFSRVPEFTISKKAVWNITETKLVLIFLKDLENRLRTSIFWISSSAIRRKGESQIECYKKTKYAKLSEK